jgi:hypothetical protein
MLTPAQAAAQLNVAERSVWGWIQTKLGEAVYMGSTLILAEKGWSTKSTPYPELLVS